MTEPLVAEAQTGKPHRFRGDVLLPVAVLGAMSFGLYLSRPNAEREVGGSLSGTQTCLSNLNRIAAAFAQYAQDYDGKFPRGVDPDDTATPNTWREKGYAGDVLTAPPLHKLLSPYVPHANIWHCPSDNGWDNLRFGRRTSSPLKPSSWARFQTSYYYYTMHGFGGFRAAELPEPGEDTVLFDGNFWHGSNGFPSMNALFADGHTQNITPDRFDQSGVQLAQLENRRLHPGLRSRPMFRRRLRRRSFMLR